MQDLVKDSSYEGGFNVNVTHRHAEDVDSKTSNGPGVSGSDYSGPAPALPHRSQLHTTHQPEHGVTCFTCVNVSNNHVCNQYAIDRPCKHGNNFCHTLHIMDPDGGSVLVNKKCANETECAPNTIGCYLIDNQKMCIACCDEDYCNKAVPSKKSNAVFRNTKTSRDKLSSAHNDRVAKNKKLQNGSAATAAVATAAGHHFVLLTLGHRMVSLLLTSLIPAPL